jgi:type 1 fimbria pilin
MKFSNIASTVVAALALVAGAAHAEDTTTPVSVNGGTVHFKGELVNAACSVNTASSEQTVNLGQYRTAKFTKVGDTTSNIPFTIELNDCDPLVAKLPLLLSPVRLMRPIKPCWRYPLAATTTPRKAWVSRSSTANPAR